VGDGRGSIAGRRGNRRGTGGRCGEGNEIDGGSRGRGRGRRGGRGAGRGDQRFEMTASYSTRGQQIPSASSASVSRSVSV
jgi:hypothetical protein